eukprot:CAMPEP_0197691574 /NCGR_PEP_ID=MMETSP1338-20131121/109917_1 /TAXON_ID=43686 ORGANISM="Pelagodinium beii, Strain RCC1491" /NCGR_SAMPLE_ID=MMETSP1338 /ASSEMBLY_ACC=CAM_ASM_000754 /LENGTH=48 /DNA_ID= /DNA_START= /DNA_END= /DNA_ORIENTATION=
MSQDPHLELRVVQAQQDVAWLSHKKAAGIHLQKLGRLICNLDRCSQAP